MSRFDRDLRGFRYAETHFGDTIQSVAYRELGDGGRWPELVWINDLIPPYLTDDESAASDRVLLAGSAIIIPAATAMAGAETDQNAVFDVDCLLRKGLLEDDGEGDFAIVSGRENLKQQLMHRVMTEQGAYLFHPDYGCSIRRLLGAINGPTAALLAARHIEAGLLSDDRVQSVTRTTATADGDKLAVDSEIVPISGRPVDLQVTI